MKTHILFLGFVALLSLSQNTPSQPIESIVVEGDNSIDTTTQDFPVAVTLKDGQVLYLEKGRPNKAMMLRELTDAYRKNKLLRFKTVKSVNAKSILDFIEENKSDSTSIKSK